jgi:hypothetical protein
LAGKRLISRPASYGTDSRTPLKITAMPKEKKEINVYQVLYGTSDKELIEAETILQAEKEAHINASIRKTLVIYVKHIL